MKRIGIILCTMFALELLGLTALTSLNSEAEAGKKLSFRRHIWPTFRRYCVRCHKPRWKGRGKKRKKIKAAGGLNLKTWRVAYKNIVDQPSKQAQEGYNIVTTSEPALSYLYYKLVGNHKNPNVKGKGKRMPSKRRRLAAWRINRIVKWIQQGAKK